MDIWVTEDESRCVVARSKEHPDIIRVEIYRKDTDGDEELDDLYGFDNNQETKMRKPQKNVLVQIRDQVLVQVRDQVWNQVLVQVRNQVLVQVQDQVRDQVWNQVWVFLNKK